MGLLRKQRDYRIRARKPQSDRPDIRNVGRRSFTELDELSADN